MFRAEHFGRVSGESWKMFRAEHFESGHVGAFKSAWVYVSSAAEWFGQK
jgi:hypothetical protein